MIKRWLFRLKLQQQAKLILPLKIFHNTLRKDQRMTQEQLGKLSGAQKAQISKSQNNTSNVTIGTIMEVLKALSPTINFKVEKQESVPA